MLLMTLGLRRNLRLLDSMSIWSAVENCGEKDVAIEMKKDFKMIVEDTKTNNIGALILFGIFDSLSSNS